MSYPNIEWLKWAKYEFFISPLQCTFQQHNIWHFRTVKNPEYFYRIQIMDRATTTPAPKEVVIEKFNFTEYLTR